MSNKKCVRCGGEKLEPGRVQSTGTLSFRPANVPFLTMNTADVSVDANMCSECGMIDLVGDVRKLQRLLGREGPH